MIKIICDRCGKSAGTDEEQATVLVDLEKKEYAHMCHRCRHDYVEMLKMAQAVVDTIRGKFFDGWYQGGN